MMIMFFYFFIHSSGYDDDCASLSINSSQDGVIFAIQGDISLFIIHLKMMMMMMVFPLHDEACISFLTLSFII